LWLLWSVFFKINQEHAKEFETGDNGSTWRVDLSQLVEITNLDVLDLLHSSVQSWQSLVQLGVSVVTDSFDFGFLLGSLLLIDLRHLFDFFSSLSLGSNDLVGFLHFNLRLLENWLVFF
jgi:hypothetical protein